MTTPVEGPWLVTQFGPGDAGQFWHAQVTAADGRTYGAAGKTVDLALMNLCRRLAQQVASGDSGG